MFSEFDLSSRSINERKWFMHYCKLCLRARDRELTDDLLKWGEKHHILPVCMGGSNEPSNKVLLSPEEHYVAHKLLAKAFMDIHSLVLAAKMMTVCYDDRRATNKMVGWLRRRFRIAASEILKGRTKETHEHVARTANALRGRSAATHPYIAQQAEKKRGRTKENHPGLARMAEKKSGRTKETCPGVASMSVALTGRTKENHPGVAKMADAIRGRNKNNDPGMAAMAATLTGRRKETDEGLMISSQKQNILPEHLREEVIHRKLSGETAKEIQDWLATISYQMATSTIYGLVRRETRRQKQFTNDQI